MRKRKRISATVFLLIILTLFAGCTFLSKHSISDNYGWNPFLWAVYHDHYRIAEDLLQNGAEPNFQTTAHCRNIPRGSTALMIAAYYGNEKMVTLLLKHGADKNIKNSNGDTARDLAARYDFTSVVDLLDKWVTDQNTTGKQ